MPIFEPFAQSGPPAASASQSSEAASETGLIIVGAGLAGLFAALKFSACSSTPVTLLSHGKLGEDSSSSWAQGGISAAVGPNDSAQLHAQDTLAAGFGLNERDVVSSITAAAAQHIEELIRLGVPFDREDNGAFQLSREAAHSIKRVVRCTGDSSGYLIMQSLIKVVEDNAKIQVIENVVVHRLLQTEQGVNGVAFRYHSGESACLKAQAVILACGGVGGLYEATTNPLAAQGQGIGMAISAGAVIADAEFVQFHPTSLDLSERPQPLASEALRGEGALLLDAVGRRFLQAGYLAQPKAELASRDIVARAVFRAKRDSGAVYLDCRNICSNVEEFAQRFPTLWQNAQRHALDPSCDLLPVTPAAHYHMGGIASDLRGRSSLRGLWAIGEVACTGLHGANRLASNSLLEAVVMGSKAAEDIAAYLAFSLDQLPKQQKSGQKQPRHPSPKPFTPSTQSEAATQSNSSFPLQNPMFKLVGVERNTEGLIRALQILLSDWEQLFGSFPSYSQKVPHCSEQQNAFLAAITITCSALLRTESRGSHFYLADPQFLKRRLYQPIFGIMAELSTNGRRSFLTWNEVCQIVRRIRTITPMRKL